MYLSDDDLLRLLQNTEDNYVERKTFNDDKDEWLQAVVAFANSLPIDYPGVLFIGVKNDGTIQQVDGLESIQKKVSKALAKAYPPIYVQQRILKVGEKEVIAVIVPGSRQRPHFAGRAFVRVGPETKEASEEQFAALIAQRQSKAYEILQWKGRTVALEYRRVTHLGTTCSEAGITIVDCNEFYVTYEASGTKSSIPLSRVQIAFDHQKSTLKLEISG